MKFEFGMVVTADYLPETRMMLTAPVVGLKGIRGRPGNWWGIVLADTPHFGWRPGDFVTLSPDNAGLRIVDTSEGTTE